MSTPLRIEYEGVYYHVMNRGRRSVLIFEDRMITRCSFYRVDGSELLKAIRDKFNEPRSVVIYLVRMLRNDGFLDISFGFSHKGYSSASSVFEVVKKKIQKNRQIQKQLEEIKSSVVIGQTEI